MENRTDNCSLIRWINGIILIGLALGFFVIPGCMVILYLHDSGLKDGVIPYCAYSMHGRLTPKYEKWAIDRVASGQAGGVDKCNISGTEWPVFGSVFYLWATESLQAEWEKDPSVSAQSPAVYARKAIDAATELVIDPNHASWVKAHWGDDYLHEENVFYRTLVIAGLTSHYKLTGDDTHLAMLRDQVDSLANELDRSSHGLLDDYPGECYPTDVMVAIVMIRRADAVLGTDHSAFAQRAIRAFIGKSLDKIGLPPYNANPDTGETGSRSRGCGDSFMFTWALEVWPEQAADWYALYEQYFWQHTWGIAGFREFPRDMPSRNWYMDVDSGPVTCGIGFAASAFGTGAARANGRFDHAYCLGAEMLAISWPMADGTLLWPRVLSDGVDAPYLGEAAILFCLTRQPVGGVATVAANGLPGFVYMMLAIYFGGGGLLAYLGYRRLPMGRKKPRKSEVRRPTLQITLFVSLLAMVIVLMLLGQFRFSLIVLFAGQLFPRVVRKNNAQYPELTN